MKLFISFLSIIFMLFSCGKDENDSNLVKQEPVVVHPEFEEYIDIIKKNLLTYHVSADKIKKIDNVSIKFGQLKPNGKQEPVAGVCKIKYTRNKVYSQKITIDLKLWRSFSHKYKVEIIAHELGHCAWGLKHVNTAGELMSPVLITNISEPQWLTFAFHIMNANEDIVGH